MLEQQPAAVAQMPAGAVHDHANRIEPIGAGCKRGGGLETQVAFVQMRIAAGDVGRIGTIRSKASSPSGTHQSPRLNATLRKPPYRSTAAREPDCLAVPVRGMGSALKVINAFKQAA